MAKILILNPNSSPSTTESVSRGLDLLRDGRHVLDCRTLQEGPTGIATQADIDRVVQPTAQYFADNIADAYVIACFSDPGLALARETVQAPVLGIAESSFQLAIGLGDRFGVVAMADHSVPRHKRYIRSLGLGARLAGDLAINVGVEHMDGAGVLDKIVEVGRRLRDQEGADVIILGCAGMGQYRQEIERILDVPVVDPSQAAVTRALALLSLGYQTAA
ncbi:aspartate/glutamate racemase family protein [Mesorhizobium sp. WSM4887]|uniref:aspartate/glutamate racemase family protein n=1 Tax=Mesorhizobium sp. WSM4887 TaxID=3038543 RepID=UPI002416F7CC|nr:aspartate/glutamate racemase family protein [Mesorhizobium sp. WSM4887]MDG4889751.1 aspartate/glutamate racemase family protein [Mesorhizobium sp. WSM4887]